MNYKQCPNCSASVGGFMSNSYIVNRDATNFINSYYHFSKDAYCDQCALPLLKEAYTARKVKREAAQNIIEPRINKIPILTANEVSQWEYEPIGIVSSQSVAGTGFLTEISSSWSDFLGSQSSSLVNKIADGENLCKDKLRYNAIALGANAIIAADIDYSEVGASKGMMMVCMSGTAVKVSRWSNNFKDLEEDLKMITEAQSVLFELQKLKAPETLT